MVVSAFRRTVTGVSRQSLVDSRSFPPPEQNPEHADVPAAFDELRNPPSRANIPLIVLTHGVLEAERAFPDATPDQALRGEVAWQSMQRDLAARSSKGRLVVAERSGHLIHRDQPDLVIEAILNVVTDVRRIH
jgi:pimeloyl-ACP methyl ester carboxylesterase